MTMRNDETIEERLTTIQKLTEQLNALTKNLPEIWSDSSDPGSPETYKRALAVFSGMQRSFGTYKIFWEYVKGEQDLRIRGRILNKLEKKRQPVI
jgi:hypothetical protein